MKFESFRFTLCHRRAAFALTFRTLRKSLNATTDGLFRSLLLIFFNFYANGCEKCGLRSGPSGGAMRQECDAALPAEARFCRSCGTRVETLQDAAAEPLSAGL